MVVGGLRLAAIGAMLIWAGVAFGAPARNPLPGTFSGSYKVTIKVTNTKPTSTWQWIYHTHSTCPSVCHAVSFRQRVVSEKSWRSTVLKFRWSGKVYRVTRKLPKYANCVAKSGATVKKGYDVTSTIEFRIRAVTDGRVTHWSGTGRDDYVPNSVGRARHCTTGAYVFTVNGVAQ